MADQIPLTRALRLLQQLSSGNWFTMAQLRDLLETNDSVRTIQRTLTAIEDAGICLERRAVAHGTHEVRLPSAFKVPPHLLSSDEALAAIILAQFGSQFAGSRVGQVLDGLLDKLNQLLPKEGIFANSDLEDLREAIHVRQPNQIRHQSSGGSGWLLLLLEAILERKVCEVHYQRLEANESRSFQVHPHSLIFHQGALYLLVWHPRYQSWLNLAFHRLDNMAVLSERFQRQEHFRLEDFLNGSFGIWAAEPVQVHLRFDAEVKAFVRERSWHPTQTHEELPDGSLRMSMRVGLSPELRAWVLRWGPHVLVEAPVEFRDELHRQLWHAASQYGPPPTSL